MATNVDSDTLTVDGQPSKVEEKWWKRISCFTEGVFTIGLCLRKGEMGSNHTVKFSKGTWHHIKIRERVHRKELLKSVHLMSATTFEE